MHVFVSGAIIDYAVVVPFRRGYAIERRFQSRDRLLKRVGVSSVYRTVCWIDLWPK
jgi:hypothetical protein